jgi:hypothetical protein
MNKWIIASLLVLLIACKKENHLTAEEKLLINKKWRLTAMTSSGSTGTTDLYVGLPNFIKDDYLVFNSSHTYEMNDGVLRDPSKSSLVYDKGNWEYISGQQIIQLKSSSPNSEYLPWHVTTLSETTLVVNFPILGELRILTYSAF